MEHTTASATLRQIRKLFSQFGMPETLVSDNGTQFTAKIFEEFCKVNGINLIHSPPYHPQSNGQAERFFDTFKRAMLKLKGEGTTDEILETFLLCYRTTPISSSTDNRSPAESFLGRSIRTNLDLIRPTKKIDSSRQNEDMESQFNRHHGARQWFYKIGDLVHVKNYREGNSWLPGRILQQKGNVIYEVEIENKVWVRHTNQLRKRSQDCNSASDSADRALKFLLDTFDLESSTLLNTDATESSDRMESTLPTVTTLPAQEQPRRCSSRRSVPPQPYWLVPTKTGTDVPS